MYIFEADLFGKINLIETNISSVRLADLKVDIKVDLKADLMVGVKVDF